jgi:hypothetical protein
MGLREALLQKNHPLQPLLDLCSFDSVRSSRRVRPGEIGTVSSRVRARRPTATIEGEEGCHVRAQRPGPLCG